MASGRETGNRICEMGRLMCAERFVGADDGNEAVAWAALLVAADGARMMSDTDMEIIELL